MNTSDVEVPAKKAKIVDKEIDGNAKTTNQAEPETPTCAFWVKRKKRFCKMTVSKGHEYCGEHEPANSNAETEDANRVPCPLDAKHTIYKKNINKHLKICNARPKDDMPYIEKGINAGDAEEETEDHTQLKISELTDEEFHSLIEQVKQLIGEYVEGKIDTMEVQVQHKTLKEELAKLEYGKESKKHLLQTAALLGILQYEQQLQNSTSFIEFGAGKGQLAFYLAQLLEQRRDSQVVLLDRMSLRHKKDNRIEDRSLVHRIRADIADLRLERLEPLSRTQRIVAISKHLCGAATDLTLRCIIRPVTTEATSEAANTEFIMIALCCHHRCEWRSFVGKEFFRSQGITRRQFTIITKMASWAICGTGMSRERRRALEEQSLSPQEIRDINSGQRLSLAERESIGIMCKRLLDYARLEFLRQHGYEACLKYYVPRDITLENVCLLARKLKSQ